MSTKEKSRELMAKNRQAQEQAQERILGRSEEEILQASSAELEEVSRELMVEHRQDETHLQETMLSRSEEEIVGASQEEGD